jgi:YVTN family beta-propeller protein
MPLTIRSILRSTVLLMAAAVVVTACSDMTAPTAGLSPAELEAAKGGHVALTHPANGTISQTVPLASSPWGLAVSSRGDVLTVFPYASAVGGFALSDPTAARPQLAVGAYPLDVIFNRSGTIAYVSARSAGRVDVIDVRSNTVKSSIPLGVEIYRLALSRDETRIYATTLDGRLWTARTKGGDPGATSEDLAPIWSPIQGKALSPSGTDLFVASTTGQVWRLDPATLDVRQTVTLPRRIQDIAVTPDGSALWAADESGYVVRLDPATLTPTATVDLTGVGAQPFGLAISPDGARIYVASSLTGTVFIIAETAPNTFSATPVTTGGAPRRIAFGENGAVAVVSNEASWVDLIR